jgi:hypothetical protein
MRATSGIGGTLTAAWGRWPRLSFRGLPTGRRKIFRSVMRFTLCSFGDELNSRSPSRGRRTHIGRGAKVDATWLRGRGKHQYEPAFQSKATDAAVLPGRRREEPRASPFASAQSCSLGFGDIGPIPARPPANHQMPRDVLRNGWLHRARGRPRPGRFARRNRPISLSATGDRRSRWRVSSLKYVRRPHPCGNKFELGSGRTALLKEAPIPLPTRCELSLPSLVRSR